MPKKSVSPDAFDPLRFLKSVPRRPGVYRMLSADAAVLYVGKASDLKNRLASYFRATGLSPKTVALVARIQAVEFTITGSDTEALLLEQNLIKEYRPPYNILLRDDKSYPYLYVSGHADYPSLTLKRGRGAPKGSGGRWFGPYPSASSVRDSLGLLHRLFRVRSCDDAFFSNRSRPCLQHQIRRCSAPCVGLVTPEEYAADVRHATLFLEGKNPQVLRELMDDMSSAAAALAFERAAQLRDQIAALRRTQEEQAIESVQGDADVIGLARQGAEAAVVLLAVRGGRILGTRQFGLAVGLGEDAEVLNAFVSQYYGAAGQPGRIPDLVILPQTPEDQGALEDALRALAGHVVEFRAPQRGEYRKLLAMAVENAQHALLSRLASKETMHLRFEALQEVLALDDAPERIECFDISHSHGESTVASCVVFDRLGPVKTDYRIYNIKNVTAGDDYAAMRQALGRRYEKLKEGQGKWPDLVLIDGGKGQLGVAKAVFDELQINDVALVGVAKGETRKAGMEQLINARTGAERRIPQDSPGLHLIQFIRDEAHRFAITGHRARRDKKRRESLLSDIAGVGPKRRRELIRFFGGVQEIKKASVDEIAKVKGIGHELAEVIYASLHQP